MASYLPGSNVQADTMQTLHLMNPSYPGYTDAANTGNLVFVNPAAGVGQNNAIGNNNQQHYLQGLPLPPALTQSSLSHQSMLATMYSSMAHQNQSSSQYSNRVSSNPYNNWSTVNELSFLPSNDVTQISQSLAAGLTSMNSGQQLNSDLSQFSMRRHDGQASMIHNGVALGLNMDNSQASGGPSQGLSLSLSPQQQPVQMQYYTIQADDSGMNNCSGLARVAAEDSGNRGDNSPNKWIGSLSHFRASPRDSNLLGSGFQGSMNDSSGRHMPPDSNPRSAVGSGGLLTGSKYLRAAQQLLDEVVSVGRGLKSTSSKYAKSHSWVQPGSVADGSFAKDGSLAETISGTKEGITGATSIPSASVAPAPEQNTPSFTEHSPQERQELQLKKAKLMAMLDEVDRRYKQYYSHMQLVVNSFESEAGLGAAKTYTALALQTISRHFRCLRDAISGQIRVASRALGEDDPSSPGLGRLRFVDQQLRQQRALQQLGMMQQHAWRPQRGLPERSVSILRAWLFEHFLHPYPKDLDKLMLAKQTGLTRNQVSNWFINARVRLWKPMVEEMYTEETKESEIDGSSSADQKSIPEDGMGDEGNPEINGSSRQARRKVGSSSEGGATETDHQRSGVSEFRHGTNMVTEVGEEQGAKKARNGATIQETWVAMGELKAEEDDSHDGNQAQMDAHQPRMDGTLTYPMGRFSYGAGTPVSLTLGLQHCDGVVGGAAASSGGIGVSAVSGGGIGDGLSASHDDGDYYQALLTQQLQNRKRFATQLLHHDFVA